MFFANTIWFWGLLGLAVPLAIHLLSRKESKVIKVGSIRFFADSPTTRFKSLRLNQILLLLLRCIIIALIVGLLADFAIERSSSGEKWLVVEKGIERTDEYQRLSDRLKNSNFEVRWLADEFPPLSDTITEQRLSYWHLATELNSIKRDCVIVLSYNYLKYFRGLRQSNNNINWITITPDDVSEELILSSGQPLLAINRKSTANHTTFDVSKPSTQSLTNSSRQEIDTIALVVAFDERLKTEHTIISAAVEAISKASPIPIKHKSAKTKDFIPSNENFIFWISEETPEWTKPRNSTLIGICFQHENLLPVLVENNGIAPDCSPTANDWLISKRLTEEVAIEERLTSSIMKVLLRDEDFTNDTFDVTTLSEEAMWSENEKKRQMKAEYEGIAGYLVLLIILGCVIERWIAFKEQR